MYNNSTKTITGSVSIADVQAALGVLHNDLGALCTSPNINPWAKHKPVRWPGIANAAKKDYHGKDNNCGLNVVQHHTLLDLFDSAKCAFDWAHIHPTGKLRPESVIAPGADPNLATIAADESEWTAFRLGDFQGYDHSARPPFPSAVIFPKGIVDGKEFAVAFPETLQGYRSEGSLTGKDIKIKAEGSLSSWYFGAAIIDQSNNILWADTQANPYTDFNSFGMVDQSTTDKSLRGSVSFVGTKTAKIVAFICKNKFAGLSTFNYGNQFLSIPGVSAQSVKLGDLAAAAGFDAVVARTGADGLLIDSHRLTLTNISEHSRTLTNVSVKFYSFTGVEITSMEKSESTITLAAGASRVFGFVKGSADKLKVSFNVPAITVNGSYTGGDITIEKPILQTFQS